MDEYTKGFIMGYVIGEGCFSIIMGKPRERNRMPLQIRPEMRIMIGIKDEDILGLIKSELEVGIVIRNRFYEASMKNSDGFVTYLVSGMLGCRKLIPFFDSCRWYGRKQKDYELWKKAIKIIEDGRHRTIEGILEIAKIRDQMNKKGKNKPRRYRNYEWFKHYLDTNYQGYTPAMKGLIRDIL
jgi:hypothetical protein